MKHIHPSPLLAVLIESALALGLLVFAGCGTTRGSAPQANTSAEAAPAQACSDLPHCRAALRKLHDVPIASQCELQERSELARSACTLGAGEGCSELGRLALAGLHDQGHADPGAARALFRRACTLGDGEGCARYGLSTLLGDGVLPDERQGQEQLQAACDTYPRDACGIAALGLNEAARRQGSAPEHEWIALFTQRGCEAGDGLACQMLGDAFHAGLGVSQDLGKAFALYSRACDAGNGAACASQGMLLLQSGQDEASTTAQADALLSRGCALGSSEACRLFVLEPAEHRVSVKGEAAQEALFRQACDRGAAIGCLALYDTLRHQPSTPGTSLELPGLLKRACRLGEARACEFLEDVSRLAWRQCGEGAAPACGVLGALLVSLPSTGSEASEGLRLLEQACQEGDARSCTLARGTSARSQELTCRAR